MARILVFTLVAVLAFYTEAQPWSHGALRVSDNGAFIEHADGEPFFWLANTTWLLPEKLDRSQASGLLANTAKAGYNVVLVQTLNDVPSVNVYGQLSHPYGWDFSRLPQEGVYGYWDHMDYIVDEAAKNGLYVGMVCIWGGLVKGGKMGVDEAKAYGKMLADRYRDRHNIVWIIGGDIKGDVKPQVWEALATSIRANDKEHLMTFHPFGRTSSAYWWNEAEWLDFNMFQSGHRRYDQTRGDGDDTAQASVAEDNWRYVADGAARTPRKPILDGEPSYEDIPHGLHDINQPRWQAADARRYAYWSVFAGAAGHTYGHNSIMQMYDYGHAPAYGATTTWYDALSSPGYLQMHHLKDLILRFPYTRRVADQTVIIGDNGDCYERQIATRGDDYLLVYTYTNAPITVDLTKISGRTKTLWWYSPTDGTYEYIGESSEPQVTLQHSGPTGAGNDWVLAACDSEAGYLID